MAKNKYLICLTMLSFTVKNVCTNLRKWTHQYVRNAAMSCTNVGLLGLM